MRGLTLRTVGFQLPAPSEMCFQCDGHSTHGESYTLIPAKCLGISIISQPMLESAVLSQHGIRRRVLKAKKGAKSLSQHTEAASGQDAIKG